MILRRRSPGPNGDINRDEDRGPGPVGVMVRVGAPRNVVRDIEDPVPRGWTRIYAGTGERRAFTINGRSG